ncbi:MAG: signal peptide prediction [Rhizobiaceae bacterium]|nr:signal peptide prediction [Rhizobiaceae bacterium]
MFEIIDSLDSLRRVVQQPESYDVYHQWHTVDLMWTARAIQPIEVARLQNGKALLERARRPLGSDPFAGIFVQSDGRLGSPHSASMAIMPIVHGVDCFGYQPALRDLISPDEPESWGWLLDSRLRGRVALVADPVLGMIEAALATEAAEGLRFNNVANLAIDEIDLVVDGLIQRKKKGHFKGFWSDSDESARLMKRGGVLAQSMFGPTVQRLRREEFPLRIANALEGGRGWHSDLCISRNTRGETLDAAYAYLDWWLSGYPGAAVSRQGYYTILPETARAYLDDAEWDYWYGGKPAARPLLDADDRPTIRPGDVRDRGSYHERMTGVRVWNAFMDEHTYLVHRWQEFLAA